MIILSITTGAHDASAVLADDYKILAAIQTERLSRVKGAGGLEHLQETVNEALSIAGKQLSDVDVVAVARTMFWRHHFIWKMVKTIKYNLYNLIGKKRHSWLITRYIQLGEIDHRKAFNSQKFIKSLGLSDKVVFFDYDHHLAHALSTLFFSKYQDALIYTADGGGDSVYYSARHLCNGELHTFYGGEEELANKTVDSIGQAYGYMTQALGYRMNRHEGKLTGLAAYGKPTIYPALKQHFSVASNGRINCDFETHSEMRERIETLAATTKPENAAASIQELLEDLVTESINIYLNRCGSRCVCLAGGVFANVALNRRIAELPGVDEAFIFPAMGDEGIAVGGLYDFLLRRDDWKIWNQQRRQMDTPYWGGEFDEEAQVLFGKHAEQVTGEPAKTAATLLANGAVVAIYIGRMEFGPRALGARSILASPVNNDINNTLNQRLQRTEFMPFAPYILEQDADDVFEITKASRYAMSFMTITCKVREEWRDKIPAVIHVDGTARPQIVKEKENPLYAKILSEFKSITGLPVLVNTSFNVHEEPIIYKPQECLRALNDGRVDYVVLANGIYKNF